jgi:DeoR/GlpR family transcriptional regulator of sugar metabolism
LSYRSVTVKSYGWYGVNGFRFCSSVFEASHPLTVITNTRIVMRVVDAEGHESKYYEIIKNIIDYNFTGNKNLKIVFFDCDWFDPNHGIQENEFGMVEVKHAYQLHSCDPFVLAH